MVLLYDDVATHDTVKKLKKAGKKLMAGLFRVKATGESLSPQMPHISPRPY